MIKKLNLIILLSLITFYYPIQTFIVFFSQSRDQNGKEIITLGDLYLIPSELNKDQKRIYTDKEHLCILKSFLEKIKDYPEKILVILDTNLAEINNIHDLINSIGIELIKTNFKSINTIFADIRSNKSIFMVEYLNYLRELFKTDLRYGVEFINSPKKIEAFKEQSNTESTDFNISVEHFLEEVKANLDLLNKKNNILNVDAKNFINNNLSLAQTNYINIENIFDYFILKFNQNNKTKINLKNSISDILIEFFVFCVKSRDIAPFDNLKKNLYGLILENIGNLSLYIDLAKNINFYNKFIILTNYKRAPELYNFFKILEFEDSISYRQEIKYAINSGTSVFSAERLIQFLNKAFINLEIEKNIKFAISKKEIKCKNCDNIGSKMCSKCHQVNYCSKDCQVKDWKNHKKNCKKN